MNKDQQRAAFESWYDEYGRKFGTDTGRYQWPATQRAWSAWQAAQQACLKTCFLSPEGSLKTHTLVSNHELQALRKDVERLDFMISEECQIQSLSTPNEVRHRLYWPDADEAQCEWSVNPRAAIDAAIRRWE